MYCSEVTSKLLYIYSVYRNSQILSLQLSSVSRVSQFEDFNKLVNAHDCMGSGNNCSYFSCYLFRKLSLIIVENVIITLFRVTTDIFNPIFTLSVTVLACFIQKTKKNPVA